MPSGGRRARCGNAVHQKFRREVREGFYAMTSPAHRPTIMDTIPHQLCVRAKIRRDFSVGFRNYNLPGPRNIKKNAEWPRRDAYVYTG